MLLLLAKLFLIASVITNSCKTVLCKFTNNSKSCRCSSSISSHDTFNNWQSRKVLHDYFAWSSILFKFCLNSSWIWFHKLTPQEIKRGMASQLASYTVYDIWNIPLQSAATKCVYIIARFSKWAIPEKIQMGLGGSGYTFLKTWSFSFFYFTPGNFRQSKAQTLVYFTKLC